MVFTTYKELKENRKHGDKVFAVRHKVFECVSMDHWDEIVPIEGTLQSSYYDNPKNGPRPPRHLLPEKLQGGKSWDDTWWDVENWIICDTKEEALEELEKQMRAAINKAKEHIRIMEYLLPSVKAETTNERGELEIPPALRRDMSLTFEEIISRCMGKEVMDDFIGDLYDMEQFLELIDIGAITDYDGYGDPVIDGFTYENVYVCCNLERIIIGDSFEIPFKRLGQVFAGHELKMLWYNK